MTPATEAAVQALTRALTSFAEELIRFLNAAVELVATAVVAFATALGEQLGAGRPVGPDLDEQWRQVAPGWMRATEA